MDFIPFVDKQMKTFILGCFNFCISSPATVRAVEVCGNGVEMEELLRICPCSV